MRRTRLWWVAAALFAASLTLVGLLAAQGKLGWAREALSLYMDGSSTTPPERDAEVAARALLQTGGDDGEIRALLDEAIAIDPHSAAVYFLGELLLREGDREGAARQYEAWLRIDPSWVPAYERLAGLYADAGRFDDRKRLLAGGLAFFQSNLDAYRPRLDPDVAEIFNEKAQALHNFYVESAARLEKMGTFTN